MRFDFFICHASEDKDLVARPLAERLRRIGWSVWFDEFELALGDGLRRAIDRGLSDAQLGIVILSPHFFAKEWPQRELDGLISLEIAGHRKAVLPIWHDVDAQDIARFSPTLADKVGVSTRVGLDRIVEQVQFAYARLGGPLPPDVGAWVVWAWDHGTPNDQRRARALMGYTILDPNAEEEV